MDPSFKNAFISSLATVFAAAITAFITRYFNEKKWKKRTSLPEFIKKRKIIDLQIENMFRIPEENAERIKRIREILIKKSRSIKLLARSGFSYLHHQGPCWYFKSGDEEGGIKWLLEQNVTMQVVLEDPFSENGECRLRADDNSRPWRDLSLDRIKEINTKYPKLDIRFTSVPILCSLFFTDDQVLYDPYQLGKLPNAETSKNNFIVIEFTNPKRKLKHSYYRQLEYHFNFILDDKLTLTYDRFIEKYKDLIK